MMEGDAQNVRLMAVFPSPAWRYAAATSICEQALRQENNERGSRKAMVNTSEANTDCVQSNLSLRRRVKEKAHTVGRI